MFGLEKLIGYPLGWIMYFIYCLVKNYGIAIVIFTVITRLIVFPVISRKAMLRCRSLTLSLRN